MPQEWNALNDSAQLALSQAALATAAETIALQAETLAEEIDAGTLADLGGADALRLLAALVRSLSPEAALPHNAGHA